MLFTSPEFLFVFLPLLLLIYFIVPVNLRNLLIFISSLFFYFTTSGELTVILLLSVAVNHLLAIWMAAARGARRRALFAGGIAANLLPLLYYKYAHFGLATLQDGLHGLGWAASIPEVSPILPVGISFFTFQALSYIADVYMGRVQPARRLVDFGMYHACFPQLIAGPIVRYEDIEHEVTGRRTTLDDFYNGAVQFCFGLAKKAVLADTVGKLADSAFGLPPGELDMAGAWLGIVAYTLQIYLDFSGYSDMAIGLGRILGFHYPENFDQPYRSCSVTEFWRRWHMTLSGWFRDYVYIPLGGNRRGGGRTLANLCAVFFLCGLWHGAAYTFVMWGVYHGALLAIERLFRGVRAAPRPLGWIWTMLTVMVGWVIFRATSLPAALDYLRSMAGLARPVAWDRLAAQVTADQVTFMALGLVVALVPYRRVVAFAERQYAFSLGWSAVSLCAAVLAMTMASVNGFTPFIYFRF